MAVARVVRKARVPALCSRRQLFTCSDTRFTARWKRPANARRYCAWQPHVNTKIMTESDKNPQAKKISELFHQNPVQQFTKRFQ
jgi:L-rhamnose mutarotase